jgi:hypothetical protein
MSIEFEDLNDAWKYLSDDFTDEGGIITAKVGSHKPTPIQLSAIHYLCNEWDYEW